MLIKEFCVTIKMTSQVPTTRIKKCESGNFEKGPCLHVATMTRVVHVVLELNTHSRQNSCEGVLERSRETLSLSDYPSHENLHPKRKTNVNGQSIYIYVMISNNDVSQGCI